MARDRNNDREPEIILDLSRLLSRVMYATPSGVDRCEMAYARGLLATVPDRLAFAVVHPSGFYGRLPHSAVLRFLDLTEERWASRGFSSIWDKRRFVAGALAALRPRLEIGVATNRPRVYLQASPNNLTRPKLIRRILQIEKAKFVSLVHDLIPIEFPEYARPDGVTKHKQRIRTIAELADGILANSHATLRSLEPWLADAPSRKRDLAVAHLGTATFGTDRLAGVHRRDHFVCVGTVEPRKNHLLLLNLWRLLARERGSANIPRLIIIGRRGWENEQVVDMLERCAVLDGCVEEQNDMTDDEVGVAVASSSALLLPSFAEGYGMPVAESLAKGTPVICSDLPALREAGGDVPEYLDPLDGPAWRETILAYHAVESPPRRAQMDRLSRWQPPSWQTHIDTVIELVDRVAR